MCLRAIKTKHYSCSAYLSSVSWAITLTFTSNRLSSFQNLRRKGGKFDHRPELPKVVLRHWAYLPKVGAFQLLAERSYACLTMHLVT